MATLLTIAQVRATVPTAANLSDEGLQIHIDAAESDIIRVAGTTTDEHKVNARKLVLIQLLKLDIDFDANISVGDESYTQTSRAYSRTRNLILNSLAYDRD